MESPTPPTLGDRPALSAVHMSAHSRHRQQVAIYDPQGSKAKKEQEEILKNSTTDWDLLKQEHQCVILFS